MYFLGKFYTMVIKYVDKYILQIITEKLLKMAIIFLTRACKFYEWKGKLSWRVKPGQDYLVNLRIEKG